MNVQAVCGAFACALLLWSVPLAAQDDWIVSETVDPLDDSRSVVLMKRSTSGSNMFGDPVRLALMCRANRTTVHVSWGEFVGLDRASVSIRVGSEQATTARWNVSTSGTATFAPSPITLIRRMMRVSRVVVRVTPYSSSSVTAVFSVAGLADRIGPLQRACNWN